MGQTLGHTFGDAPGFWYPYLWSWGGKEVEADGKTVALNSKETVESVKFAVAVLEGLLRRGRARLGRFQQQPRLSVRHHQRHQQRRLDLSRSQSKPDTYQTEKGTPMKDDILHAPLPTGAGGQFNLPVPFTNMLMGYSKNQKAAKDFLRWVNSKPVFEQWFTSQQGYTDGATKDWEKDTVWDDDPVMLPFRDLPNKGRLMGYAGPPSRAAAEAGPSTSSSTCTPRRSRAWRPRTRSNGRMTSW